MSSYVVAVTGHREPRQDHIAHAEAMLTAWQQEHELTVITGGARGTDQHVAAFCLAHAIAYRVYLPFSVEFMPASVHLAHLCAHAEAVRVVADAYAVWHFEARNRMMVDDADIVLAVWDGRQTGGTWNCIEYARRTGKPVATMPGVVVQSSLF